MDDAESALDMRLAKGSLVGVWTSARKQESSNVGGRMAHLLVDRSPVIVIGPAYLDRVIRVDRSLVELSQGSPLDQSVDGTWRFGSGLKIVDSAGGILQLDLPATWPGPQGVITLSRPLLSSGERHVIGLEWHDDLGGMGAGYAGAFGAKLMSALGPVGDPMSQAIHQLLELAGIEHRPVRIPGTMADWTLLISSGGFGDKLPIGFRGCHSSWTELPSELAQSCQLRIVAALPNRLAEQALRTPGAQLRMFAPAMRNVLDRDRPIEEFSDAINLLACNRQEWDQLADPDRIDSQVDIVAITNGPLGSAIRYTNLRGHRTELAVPVFPRARPPLDTNRAGEAYASTLVASLLNQGWTGGRVTSDVIEKAASRATAAAALVLDRRGFGFPSPSEIDLALANGRID